MTTMEDLRYPFNIVSLVSNMYKASTMFVSPSFEQTQFVALLRWTIQGDLFSPYTSSYFFLNLRLRWWQGDDYGYYFNVSDTQPTMFVVFSVTYTICVGHELDA